VSTKMITMGRSTWAVASILGVTVSLFACGGNDVQPAVPTGTSTLGTPKAATAAATVQADVLGPKPEPKGSVLFLPETPKEFKLASGMRVLLLERKALPLVSLTWVSSQGSASDPDTQVGLANLAARMRLEGAGALGSTEFTQAVDALGASLTSTVYVDYATVSLTVLTKNLGPAASLWVDAIVKPRNEAKDFARAKGLLVDELKAEGKEPKAVADRVAIETLFGELKFGENRHYGNAKAGRVSTVTKLGQKDIQWVLDAPPQAGTLVVVGDIDEAGIKALLGDRLSRKDTRAPRAVVPLRQAFGGTPPKVVLVERPDAAQSVVALVLPGLAAKQTEAAALSMANTVLGGSFTSRLNQDLREERGLSYGASSRVSAMASPGYIYAGAAVYVDKTGEAAKALLEDIERFAKEGPTEEEAVRAQKIAQSELLESYASVSHTASRLARIAGLGLPIDQEKTLAEKRAKLSRADLAKSAADFFAAKGGFLLVVGPASVRDQLKAVGITDVVVRSPKL
jgi:zinc protease